MEHFEPNIITLEILDKFVASMDEDHRRDLESPDLVLVSKPEWEQVMAGTHPIWKKEMFGR